MCSVSEFVMRFNLNQVGGFEHGTALMMNAIARTAAGKGANSIKMMKPLEAPSAVHPDARGLSRARCSIELRGVVLVVGYSVAYAV